MSEVEVEQFAGGSLRVTAYPWVLVGDRDLRFPLNARTLFDGPPRAFEVTAEELAEVFAPAERRRLAAIAVSAYSALMYAGGAQLAGFRLIEAPDEGAYAAIPGEGRDDLPLTVMVAAQLAAQAAKERTLRAEGRGAPTYLAAAAQLGASGIALLPTAAAEPVALLYGPSASAPEGFTGGAIHMDYLEDQARAWLAQNSERVDVLAEAALARGEMDAASIERVLTGEGAGEPVRALAAQHPLRRPTPIPFAVIDTVADFWSDVLRRKLVGGAAQPGEAAEIAEQVEEFRRALSEQISARIERREARGEERIGQGYEVELRRLPFSVGVGYEPDPVLQDALTAVGLRPTELYGLMTWVEFQPDLVRKVTGSDGVSLRTVLWTASDAHALPVETRQA